MGTPITVNVNRLGPSMVTAFRYYAGLAKNGVTGDSFPIEGGSFRVSFEVCVYDQNSECF